MLTPAFAAPGSGESLVAGARIGCLPHWYESVAAVRIIWVVEPTMLSIGQYRVFGSLTISSASICARSGLPYHAVLLSRLLGLCGPTAL